MNVALRRACGWPVVLLAASTQLGCASGGARSPAATASEAPRPRTRVTSGALWHVEAAPAEITVAESMVAQLEQQTLLAGRMAVGATSAAPGLPAPTGASKNFSALKKANVKLSLAKVDAGMTSWFELRDDASARLATLGRKVTEGTATPAEKAEQRALMKHTFRLNDLHQQVDAAARASGSATPQVLAQGFAQMLRTASRARARGVDANAWRPEDRDVVRRDLALQARFDAVAAASTALLAAYRAVIEQGADPRGLDAVAAAVSNALPAKPEISDAQVNRYVAELSPALRAFRPRYEASMKDLFGEAQYASAWKGKQDALFDYVEEGGTALPTPVAVAPDSQKARASSERNGGDLIGTGRALASQLGLGSVETALRGAIAVQKGDARGAIDAAIELLPVPGVKDAWHSASALLFGN